MAKSASAHIEIGERGLTNKPAHDARQAAVEHAIGKAASVPLDRTTTIADAVAAMGKETPRESAARVREAPRS